MRAFQRKGRQSVRRTAFRALYAIAVVGASACTLIESRGGLVGPPLDGSDASLDGFAGNDAHAKDGSDGDAGVLEDSPIGDDASDGQNIIDAATDGPKPVATTLYTGQTNPTGIFADGTSIYWVAGGPRGLFKGLRTGGLPTTIARLDDVNQVLGEVFDLVVDSTYVYWTDRKGFVYRRALTGGAYELCFSVPSQPAFLAIGFGALYTTDYNLIDGGGSVFRGTCGQPVTTMFGSQPRASGIGVGATPPELYWGRNGSDQIAFGPPDGSAPNTFHFVVGAVDGIATDGEAMYWIAESRRIVRFDFKTALEVELFAEDGSFGEGDIAVDSDSVYWTELANSTIKKIAKLPPDGG